MLSYVFLTIIVLVNTLYVGLLFTTLYSKNEALSEQFKHYFNITHITLQIFVAITLLLIANPFYRIEIERKMFYKISFSAGINILFSLGLHGISNYLQNIKKETVNVVRNIQNI